MIAGNKEWMCKIDFIKKKNAQTSVTKSINVMTLELLSWVAAGFRTNVYSLSGTSDYLMAYILRHLGRLIHIFLVVFNY